MHLTKKRNEKIKKSFQNCKDRIYKVVYNTCTTMYINVYKYL